VVIVLYRIGKKYKIELKKGIFYTGIIDAEDDISIKINTIRNEEIILNKSEIQQSWKIEDSIGDKDGKRNF